MSQMPPNTPPVVPSPSPQKKKGLPPLAWVAIGCGGLLVVAVLIVAAGGFFVFHKARKFAAHPETAIAQMIVAGNPDLEVVTVDDGAGTVTVRNKKTGEVLTLNLSDVKKGKIVFKDGTGQKMVIETAGEGEGKGITMKSDKGSFALGGGAEAKIPSWIPSWPGVTVQSTFSGEEAGQRTGMYQFQLEESLTSAMDYGEKELRKAGLTPKKSTYDLGGQNAGGVLTVDEGGKNATLTFAYDPKDKKTTVAVVYEEKE